MIVIPRLHRLEPALRRELTVSLCAIALCAAPALLAAPVPGPDAALPIAPVVFTERVLANGLQVVAAVDRSSPTVAIQVWYHVGSKDDPAGRSGFAHLFEHLMFKSTRYLKNEQFDRLTEDVGGANNAYTSDDVTVYQEVVPANHLETLLWAEAERMSNLSVDDTNFRSERGVVEEEYRQRVLASPYGRFYNGVSPSAYRVHPYKRPGIGSIEDLEAATLVDVVEFHRNYYRPDNATLVVTGDFDSAQLESWVDRYFGPVAKPTTPIPRVTATEPAWPDDRVTRLQGPQVPLPAVALSWLAPPVTHPDTAAWRVTAALLAGGESSRLNQSLVYRQRIASEAGFEADLRVGPSLLTAYAIAASGKSLGAIAQALTTELRRLAAEPIGAAELAKVKTQLLTQALIKRQTPAGMADALGEAAVLAGKTSRVNQQLADLQAVTAADVRRVLQQTLLNAHHARLEYTAESTATAGAKK